MKDHTRRSCSLAQSILWFTASALERMNRNVLPLHRPNGAEYEEAMEVMEAMGIEGYGPCQYKLLDEY